MSSFNLAYPVELEGDTIRKVTIGRPTGAMMVEIGDHFQVLMALAGDADGGVKQLNAETFKAIVAVAGALTGLGTYAGKLDWTDLQEIATQGMSRLGESLGSPGAQEIGAT